MGDLLRVIAERWGAIRRYTIVRVSSLSCTVFRPLRREHGGSEVFADR